MGNTTLLFLLLAFACVGMTGCSKADSSDSSGTAQAPIQSASSLPSKGNFRLSLTDAPHPSLSHVFVNVDHVELLLEKNGDAGRLSMGQNMGTVDLLTLRDGVHLPIQDLDLQEAVVVKQFRMVLKDTGHSLVRLADGSTCELQTPSQQQTGLKLIMPNGGVRIEKGQLYSLIIDFDVDHSIVDNKHTCLLKPVLKVKTLLQVPATPDDSGEEPTEDPDDGGGNTTPDDGSPTDDGGGNTTPDDGSGNTPPDDGGGTTTPDDGTTTGGETPGDDTSTGGETPDDGTNTDSGGTVDPDDGAPIIIEGDPRYFN